MNKNIVATIGPETCSESALKFINKYCDIYRLNGSHNTINWHESISKTIKLQNKDSVVLLDIPGVKPRTLNKEAIKIKKNEEIIFSYKKITLKGKRNILISNKLPKINNDIKRFSIEDGQYNFLLEKRYKNYIVGKSLQEFILYPKKGLNIPNSVYDNIYQEKINIVPLYFAKERPVIKRDDLLLMVDDKRLDIKDHEKIENRLVRFRTLGCYPLTGAIESTAKSVEDIIIELLESKNSEREGRAIDKDQIGSMEKKKQEGYF